MNNKLRIYPFLVVAVVFLAASGWSCRKNISNTTKNSFQDFSIPDVLIADQAFSNGIADAGQKAREWKADAYLVIVDIFFEGTKISSSDKPLVYFQSHEDKNENNYIVTLLPDFSGIVKTETLPIQKSDQMDNYEILSHEWVVGYAEALKIADENQGAVFRGQHPGFGIVVELSKSLNGLEWGVFYSGSNSSNQIDRVNIYLNAANGSIKANK